MKTKKYSLLLGLFLFVFLLSSISATNICGNDNSFLGEFNKNDIITLSQQSPTATYVNISSITYPDSHIQVLNEAMTKNGANFNYTFRNATVSGCYSYVTIGDPVQNTTSSETIYFKINGTPNKLLSFDLSKTQNIVLLACYILMVIGFLIYGQFVLVGGMIALGGVFLYFNGSNIILSTVIFIIGAVLTIGDNQK